MLSGEDGCPGVLSSHHSLQRPILPLHRYQGVPRGSAGIPSPWDPGQQSHPFLCLSLLLHRWVWGHPTILLSEGAIQPRDSGAKDPHCGSSESGRPGANSSHGVPPSPHRRSQQGSPSAAVAVGDCAAGYRAVPALPPHRGHAASEPPEQQLDPDHRHGGERLHPGRFLQYRLLLHRQRCVLSELHHLGHLYAAGRHHLGVL